jgi:Dolichyl-phosphate-mannose-protein mannosyltransferase
MNKIWNQNRGKDRDDRNDDHQLDQRKPLLKRLMCCMSFTSPCTCHYANVPGVQKQDLSRHALCQYSAFDDESHARIAENVSVGSGQAAQSVSVRRVLFFLVLACAAIARLPGLFTHSTMPDEAFTFFISSHSLAGIVTLLRTGDFHPPLVYLIGHVLLGFTSRAYLFRAVTAVFGIAGVAASYALARRIVGPWAAIPALLVAVNPVLAFFDGFFRMYAMLWSLAMISWACLLWALDAPRMWRRWVAYAIALIALLYTQYLAFFTFAAQILYVLFARRKTVGFWAACSAAIAAFLPWLPVFIAQYPLGGTAFNALSGHLGQLFGAPPVLLIDGVPPHIEYATLTVLALWLAILGGMVIAFALRRWVALALIVPVVLQVAYSLFSGKLLLGQRYLLQGIPPLIFLIALLCAWLWTTRARIAGLVIMTALLILMVTGTFDKHVFSPYMPVNWTQYGKFLDDQIQPGDAVVFDSAMVYYALVGTKATTNRQIFLVTNQREAARYGKEAARLGRVWYVGYQTELPDPKRVAFFTLVRSHPKSISWKTTQAAYGDVVETTLFLPAGRAGP